MSLEKSPAGDASRRRAAAVAADEIVSGMKLGLGSGRTAEHFVRELGRRIREERLAVSGVPTSEQTARLAIAEGVPLITLDSDPELDLTVDGADEIDGDLRLIKGAGGALLREKIVATASKRMIVVADAAKVVKALGACPLPIEVIPFGLGATRVAIRRVADRLDLHGEMAIRMRGEKPFVTDGGNHILDASFGRIPDPDTLAAELNRLPGVVEHGLFIGLATAAIVADGDRVEWLRRDD
jgi:ribose 5-phosphate isomerase A